MLWTVVGFVHLYIFTVTIGVLNNAYYKLCSTSKVLHLACNLALIKCFIFQQLAVLIVRVACCRWHKSWSHVQGVRWCAIDWLVFVTEMQCLLRGTGWVFNYNWGYPQSVPTDCTFVYQFSSPVTVPFIPLVSQLCPKLPVQCLDCLPTSPSGTRTFWSTCLSATVSACSLTLWEVRNRTRCRADW